MPDTLTSYDHDGLTFRVRDEGPRDGAAIVLLHGFPQGPECWDRVVPHLHEAGFRTLAPEQRGYSPGARPRRRRDYRGGLLVGDVVALIDLLGDAPVHLVGHDWGAAVAWGVAGRRPDLLASLTAVSVAHPGAFVTSMLRSNQLLKSWYMGAFQLPFIPERVLSATGRLPERFLARTGMDREMTRSYRRRFRSPADLRGPLNWYRALPMSSRRDLAARITVPTTMVFSDGDVALSVKGAELAAGYVDAPYHLEVLPGISHWVPEQAPDLLADLILDRTGPAASVGSRGD